MQKNKRTTLQDIAEHTGFSVATVSRVLSGSPRISDDTRRKIIRCADMYNYRMKCKNVAMLTLGYGLYFSNMLTALQKEFLNSGYRAFAVTDDMLDLLDDIPLHGAVSLLNENGLEQVWSKRYSCPLVCINTHYNWLDKYFSITVNDKNAVESAIHSLYAAGHRRIARITVDFREINQNAIRREQTLIQLSKELGFELITESSSGETPFDIVFMLRRLLEKKVTAIICVSELITPQLKKAADILQVRIPEDLSIVAWSSGEQDWLCADWELYMQNYAQIARQTVEIFSTIDKGLQPAKMEEQIDYIHHPGHSIAPPRL
ncbi:MAG: LacI family DNA-binding transcriptional regulator [Lentisphaeria bacterium]|nr:LacI family DNA-binding transcriptional regulator [Lentisphaeria bacterium]